MITAGETLADAGDYTLSLLQASGYPRINVINLSEFNAMGA